MDIKAFRKDLAQKSTEAKKTNFSEDKINVTFSGISSENKLNQMKNICEELESILHELKEETKIRLGGKDSRKKIIDASHKRAKQDYDGDGQIESSPKEYLGSKDKAIKKAMQNEELNYYKNLSYALEEKLAMLEGTMSKAKRVGKKYPSRIRQAEVAQERRLDRAEKNKGMLSHELTKNENMARDLTKKHMKSPHPLEDLGYIDYLIDIINPTLTRKRSDEYRKEVHHLKNLDKLKNLK